MINKDKRCNDLTGKEWLQNSFSIWRNFNKTPEEKELKHPASYPVSLCEKLISTFSRNEGVVLDPFSGIGSTLVAAKNLNRSAIGIDLSTEFCELARHRIGDDCNISIINGDSLEELKKMPSNTVNLCLTSPPYWDILNMKRSADGKEIQNYSDNPNDLGNISDYKIFLNSLTSIFKCVYDVLISGSYCLINVMDIRKKNIFYSLHSDIAMEMQKIGFIYDDIIIWDRQHEYNNMRPLGYPYKFRINKVHEYILIFIKK